MISDFFVGPYTLSGLFPVSYALSSPVCSQGAIADPSASIWTPDLSGFITWMFLWSHSLARRTANSSLGHWSGVSGPAR